MRIAVISFFTENSEACMPTIEPAKFGRTFGYECRDNRKLQCKKGKLSFSLKNLWEKKSFKLQVAPLCFKMITCVRGRNILDAYPFKNEHREVLLFICRKRNFKSQLFMKIAWKISLLSYFASNLLWLQSF